MATDREIIKERQTGQAQAYGLAGAPKAAVAAVHSSVLEFELGADASIAEMGRRAERAFRVVSAHFTPATALAISGASYTAYDVQKRDGAGGAAVSTATLTTFTGGTALSAFVPAAFTLSTTAANLEFAVGNVITFKSTETGTPTSPIGKVTVYVEYI